MKSHNRRQIFSCHAVFLVTFCRHNILLNIKNMNNLQFTKTGRAHYEINPLPAGLVIGCAGRAVNSVDYTLPSDEIRSQEKDILHDITKISIKNILSLEQVHGAEVIAVNKDPEAPNPTYAIGDAMITNLTQVCLVIRTADCLPVLITDKQARFIGAVHSGWRGTHLGIAGITAAKMKATYGCAGSDLLAFILPSIGPDSYEVNEDVSRYFPNQTLSRNNKLFVNLWEAVTESLLAENIPAENIFKTNICNYQQTDEFFSHRYGDKGRNLNFIFIK